MNSHQQQLRQQGVQSIHIFFDQQTTEVWMVGEYNIQVHRFSNEYFESFTSSFNDVFSEDTFVDHLFHHDDVDYSLPMEDDTNNEFADNLFR